MGLDRRPNDAFMQGMTAKDDKPAAAPVAPVEQAAAAPKKPLTPAAERALAEAAARRAARAAATSPTEVPGRDRLDPVRYGDWEVKGIASDF
jgi:hypothetical protein